LAYISTPYKTSEHLNWEFISEFIENAGCTDRRTSVTHDRATANDEFC